MELTACMSLMVISYLNRLCLAN